MKKSWRKQFGELMALLERKDYRRGEQQERRRHAQTGAAVHFTDRTHQWYANLGEPVTDYQSYKSLSEKSLEGIT